MGIVCYLKGLFTNFEYITIFRVLTTEILIIKGPHLKKKTLTRNDGENRVLIGGQIGDF